MKTTTEPYVPDPDYGKKFQIDGDLDTIRITPPVIQYDFYDVEPEEALRIAEQLIIGARLCLQHRKSLSDEKVSKRPTEPDLRSGP